MEINMRLYKANSPIPTKPNKVLNSAQGRKCVLAVDERLRLVALITTDPVRLLLFAYS